MMANSRIVRLVGVMWWLSGILAVSILCLEFIFDISAQGFWRDIVLSLDVLLIFAFISILICGALPERHDVLQQVLKEKLNFFILLLVLILFFVPRLAGVILIGRLAAVGFFALLDTRVGRALSVHVNLKPSQTLALSFVALICFGTLLLTFPAATTDGRGTPPIDALFTITSAACVTGLMVINDAGAYFTLFGQVVILAVIQVGGLGIMVLSASFAVLVGGRLPSRRQAGFNEILDVRTIKGLKSLIAAVAATTLIMESVGAILLFTLWSDNFGSFFERVWWSVFHAVSAFCNAGIGLAPDSIAKWIHSPGVSATFILLITVGGIGFMVIADLIDPRTWSVFRPAAIWGRLHVQTKIVLLATLILDVGGMLLFLFLEYDGILHGLSVWTKINASIFHSVTLRTAGFSMLSLENLAIPTVLFCCVWMFIGASPGSCAGGIKTTTAAVCLMSVRSMLRGREQVEVFGRQVPTSVVIRSLSIVLVSVLFITLFLILLTGTQQLPLEKLFFEVFSAFGTVGLSMNLSPQLDSLGKVLVSGLMYIGRIGPLTLALALGQRHQVQGFSFPEARIAVG